MKENYLAKNRGNLQLSGELLACLIPYCIFLCEELPGLNHSAVILSKPVCCRECLMLESHSEELKLNKDIDEKLKPL